MAASAIKVLGRFQANRDMSFASVSRDGDRDGSRPRQATPCHRSPKRFGAQGRPQPASPSGRASGRSGTFYGIYVLEIQEFIQISGNLPTESDFFLTAGSSASSTARA